MCCECFLRFFFSSRRRHTRFDCDWSSDVCSSDLGLGARERFAAAMFDALGEHQAVRETAFAHPGLQLGDQLARPAASGGGVHEQQVAASVCGHGENLVVAVGTPKTRYAQSGEHSIAYQVVGEGDLDLIYMPGFASNLDVFWEEPRYSRFLHRLASFSRLILIDRLGTGLSDPLPPGESATLEQRVDDIGAVMDAVGIDSAAVLAWSEATMPCVLFAATYPERVQALVLYGGMPTVMESDDFPYGTSAEGYDDFT